MRNALKNLLMFCLMVTGMASVWADGSSGEYLLSPENDVKATKQFGSSSDTYDRGGWYFDGSRGYARQNGVALPKASAGTLCYDFPDGTPDVIYSVDVVCRTATGDSATKEHQLDLSLVGADLSASNVFTTGSTTTSVTVTFTFDTLPTATGLRLSNPGSALYEVASVTWRSTYPELSANYTVPTAVLVGGSITGSVNAITGGTGVYTLIQVTFNGETQTFTQDALPIYFTFDAPIVSGSYPITVTIRDSKGSEQVYTQDITITPYAPPMNVTASNVTRNSLDLAWKLNTGATPISYKLEIALSPKTRTQEVILSPEWEQDEEGNWVSVDSYDFTTYTDGFKMNSCIVEIFGDVTDFKMSKDGGSTWNIFLYKTGGKYASSSITAANQKAIRFRVSATTPPRYLGATLTTAQSLRTDTIEASAQLLTHSVTNLSTGKTLELTLSAVYQKEDGSTTIMKGETLTVQTEALPGFTSVEHYPKWKMLQLTWPQDESVVSGDIRIYMANAVAYLTTPGLYLTRILWTKSGDGLTTSKAVALTNTTTRPIHLNGKYTLQAVKRDTGTTRLWDFSETDAEGNVTYPHILAPGGELIVAHSKYQPSDLREGVVLVSASAMNFTADWDVSLLRNDLVQNTLTPQTNALVRLAEDSLETLEVTAVTADLPKLDALYSPWSKIEEVLLMNTITLQKTDTVNQFNYASYLKTKSQTRRIWADCRVKATDAYSDSTNVSLWEAPLAEGFRFSLR